MERAITLCAVVFACVAGWAKSDADVIVLAPDADTRILTVYPNRPDPNPEYLSVYTNEGPSNEQRSLVHFDLGAVAQDQWITSARLTLFSCTEFGTNTNGDPMNIFRLTTSWVETDATWNHRDGIATWSTPGAAADAVGRNGVSAADSAAVIPYAVSTAKPTASDQPVTWDMTDLVAEWQRGTPNFGLLLLAPPGNGLHFWSKEYSVAELRPMLEVKYQDFAEWGADGGGSWGDSAKWRGPTPNGRGHVAKFAGSLATPDNAPAIITLDGDRTLGSLTFDNAITNGASPFGYVIVSGTGGRLILQSNGSGAALNVLSGAHSIEAPVQFVDDAAIDIAPLAMLKMSGGIHVAATKTLTKSNGGMLDIGGVQMDTGAALAVAGGRVEAEYIRGGSVAIHSNSVLKIKPNGTKASVSKVYGLPVDGIIGDWRGQLDITDNDLIIQSDESAAKGDLDRIIDLVISARDGKDGRWTGQGITSSIAAADKGGHLGLAVIRNLHRFGGTYFGFFDDQPVDGNSIIVRYTWNGDASFDGIVNADDYGLIDRGFTSQEGGWYNGDFNYDGVVNADDYGLIDRAFIGQSGQLSATSSAMPVPDPAASMVLFLAGTIVLARRRRRSGLPAKLSHLHS